jgi:hypothetical protein
MDQFMAEEENNIPKDQEFADIELPKIPEVEEMD